MCTPRKKITPPPSGSFGGQVCGQASHEHGGGRKHILFFCVFFCFFCLFGFDKTQGFHFFFRFCVFFFFPGFCWKKFGHNFFCFGVVFCFGAGFPLGPKILSFICHCIFWFTHCLFLCKMRNPAIAPQAFYMQFALFCVCVYLCVYLCCVF